MIRISSRYFVAGVVLSSDDRVCRWAPILKYMRGWTVEKVEEYCKKKGWKFEVLDA